MSGPESSEIWGTQHRAAIAIYGGLQGALPWQVQAGGGFIRLSRGGPGGPGALGVKGLGWLNSECVKAREIRLQRQTEVMINFSSLPTVVFPCEHSAGLAWPGPGVGL